MQIKKYRKLAYSLAQHFDRILYTTFGSGVPLAMWSLTYNPEIRRHHEHIMFAVREYIPNQLFVDNHWRDMKSPNRKVTLSAS